MKKAFQTTGILLAFIMLIASCGLIKNEPQKPKNIILLIGDGMGVSEVYAGLTANKGSLNLERCTEYGFSKTQSASHYVTDSGAGGTAIATGKKTYNGAISVDTDTLPVKTILEYAEDEGLSTGLVSTSSITHATPASFIAHRKSRSDYEGIASDFLKVDIDLFIGGGLNNFNKRKDSVNLIEELTNKGYQVVYSMDEAETIDSGKLVVFTAPFHNVKYSEGRGDMLPKATKKAIDVLSKNEKGFFVMIEGSMIDWGGHANDCQYIINEMLDFDRAVKEALDFAELDGETGAFTTKGHTGVMVPVFAYGPGAHEFSGIQENTELFEKMMKLLDINEPISGR